MEDLYRTIQNPSEGLFKDKGSKFIAYTYEVDNENEIKEHIQHLKKEHYSARHHCYAWRLGADKLRFRANDDGEPSSSAGKPILGQIQSYDLTNILIVVVRYFGGTLLGVSGLINAYRAAAKDAIENTQIIEKTVEQIVDVHFGYENMNDVMKLFKEENLTQLSNKFDLQCIIKTSVRLSEVERICNLFKNIDGVRPELID